VPYILDAAARGFPEFTADATSLKNSVDHCALTTLHDEDISVYVMIKMLIPLMKVKLSLILLKIL
jgi:hypothetical protein